ncbi:hypothetical protein Tsubulata_023670 [Turnera subulata]|uniref:non-specific serine/threonine protein kinase n=1 Tax=Turnera subulata TaxID=218843 RepID=A0A9Q0JGB9_9ROSI|nr:hypothetical protein Tsubulata_023670 [Turnera subulata]
MAAIAEHTKPPLSAFIPWRDPKDFDVLGVRAPQAKIPCRTRRRGSMLPTSASACDLTSPDTASSPRGVIEGCLQDLEASAHSSKQSNRESKLKLPSARALSNWSRFFKSWKRAALKRLTPSNPPPPESEAEATNRKSRSSRENPKLRDLYNFKSSLKNFTFSELKTATNNFSQANLIGKGGFAEVYRGCLPNGKYIAVKRLTRGTTEEKTSGFLSELGIIAHIDHLNTAKVLGSGIDGGMFLVFELSRLGSLGYVLHDPSSEVKLDWSKRYKIAMGIANGLHYLHESCQKRIIHRDIKAENILLTEDFVPQICDFGLAKWLPSEWTHHNISKFEGTFGYFAPEYFMHGIVDEKTDIFAYGVLLLELITGRRAVDHSQQSLVKWAKPLLDNNDIKELVDPKLASNYDPEEMERVVLTASLCIEHSPVLRPRMSQARWLYFKALVLLRGDEQPVGDARFCGKKTPRRRTYSVEIFDAHEYNSTKHFQDLTRLRQIALAT